jgi:hypothetical protein
VVEQGLARDLDERMRRPRPAARTIAVAGFTGIEGDVSKDRAFR